MLYKIGIGERKMTIKFGNSQKGGGGLNIALGNKKISKIMFNGKLVYEDSLPAGTIFFDYGSELIGIPAGKTIEVSLEGVKPDFTNVNRTIKLTGIRIGKKFYSTMTKNQLITGITLNWGLKAKIVQGTNKIAFNYYDGDNGLGVIKIELV